MAQPDREITKKTIGDVHLEAHQKWENATEINSRFLAYTTIEGVKLMTLVNITAPAKISGDAFTKRFFSSMVNDFDNMLDAYTAAKMDALHWGRQNLKGGFDIVPVLDWLNGVEHMFICQSKADEAHCVLHWSGQNLNNAHHKGMFILYDDDWYEKWAAHPL